MGIYLTYFEYKTSLKENKGFLNPIFPDPKSSENSFSGVKYGILHSWCEYLYI